MWIGRWILLTTVFVGCGLTACAQAGSADDGDDSPPEVDGGLSFLPDAAASDAQPCSLSDQTGCDTGLACDLGDTNQPECRIVGTAGAETATCSGNEGCAAGYGCINAGAAASCMEWCDADVDCTAPGGLCLIQIVDMNKQPIAGAKVCTQNCEPVSGSGCPPTWGCHIYQESAGQTRKLTQCSPPGASGQGQTCTDNRSCQAGFVCLGDANGANKQCIKWCNQTAGGGGCPTSTLCRSFSPALVFGGQEYGYCF
jgi:hypothetical protein